MTDVLGSILLVGMTVVVAAGLGLLLLSFDGPTDEQFSRLAVTMAPGTGGWNTADEEVRVSHLRGEPLRANDVRITIRTPAGGTTTLSGAAQLGGAFADGRLTIGETWTHTVTAALNDLYRVDVVVGTGSGSQLVAATRIVAGSQGGGALCLGDTQAPTATFAQTPANVNSQTVGAVTVTLTAVDNCAGVDETVTPRLFWCVAVTCTVPSSYTDAGPMTDTGTRTWAANVPARPWLTEAVAGRSLRYYVTNMADLNGNTGQSGVQTDLVDLVLTYTYVASANAVTGTVANLANAQQASAGDGVEADLAEAGALGSPGSAGPTRFSGATVTNGGALNPNNALVSDDARTEFDTSGDFIEVTGLDLPANAAAVTSVTIGVEARKASTGGTSPQLRLDFKLGASGTYSNGAQQTISNSGTDSDYTRTLSGITTVSAAESIYVRVFYQTDTNRNPQVDHVFVTVAYTTAALTEYRMNIELEWSGVTAGASNTLELRYRATGDTYNLQVWNFVALTWRTCSGTLNSATLASFTCALLANEISAGEVLARATDVTPTGTTQGHLFLDHARVAVA